MKKTFLFLPIVASALFLAVTGCSNAGQEQQSEMHDGHEMHDNHEMHNDHDMHGAQAGTHDLEGVDPKNIDPICEMVRDETWTDFTVHQEDTVWFCSEHCKDAFAANPGKYRN